MAKKKDEWITVAQAAVIAGCTDQTIRNRSRDDRGSTKKEGRRRMVRRSWAETLVVGRSNSWGVAQIEGLKTRLAAVEKERDEATTRGIRAGAQEERDYWLGSRKKWAACDAQQKKEIESLKTRLAAAEKERDHWKTEAIEDRTLAKEWERKHTHAVRQESRAKSELDEVRARLAAVEKERDQASARRSSHAKAREKWAADHARQANQIGALEARLVREARAYKQLRTDNEALRLEIQTYADTYAEAHPPAVIDRLVSAVESAPLGALMQIDKPRHAALRRVVHLWTAVQHAVGQFTPGDCAQTNNDDEEVT